MHTTNPTAVTAARIESALDLISEVMLLHERPQFAPYLDRLEQTTPWLGRDADSIGRPRVTTMHKGRLLNV